MHLGHAYFYSQSRFTSGRKKDSVASLLQPHLVVPPAAAVLLLLSCLVPSQLAAFPLPFHLFFLPSFLPSEKERRKEGNCFMLQQGAFPFLSFARVQRESKYEIQVICL